MEHSKALFEVPLILMFERNVIIIVQSLMELYENEPMKQHAITEKLLMFGWKFIDKVLLPTWRLHGGAISIQEI